MDAEPEMGHDDLQEVAARFEATFEQAGVGIAHVALDGRWLRVNQRLCDIVGYGREELSRLTFQDITHPDDLEKDLAQADQLRRGTIPSYTIEKRYLRKDGAVVWVQLTGSLASGPSRGAGYFIAVVQDISRRKQAEQELAVKHEALERERRRLQSVLDLLPAGLWIADAEGRIVATNPGAREIWGGDAPVTGDPARYHEDYRAYWNDGRPLSAGEWGLARAIEKGERSGPEEVLIEGFDGLRRTILNYGVPIRDEAGHIDGAVALSLDISERKRAEEALRKTNEHLSLLLGSASGLLSSENPRDFIGALFRDLAHHLDLAVYFNYLVHEGDAGPRLHLDSAAGVDPSAIAANSPLGFGNGICSSVALNRERVVLERVQESDDPAAEIIRSLGVTAYVCHPLFAGSELLGTLSFGLDSRSFFEHSELVLLQAVSDHVALAIQRSRSRAAERAALLDAQTATQARTDFMATMSHELRTPLNAIMGYTELLENGVPAPMNEAHRRYVARIRIGAQHIRQLIDEILAFSRLEAGQERVEIETMNLADLLEAVSVVIDPLASNKGLVFRVDHWAAPATLRSDPRKLGQILLNLLGNAVKFTEQGEIRLDVTAEEESVVLAVADTGIGIEPEDRHNLFKPFWQAGHSLGRRAGGTGLGLSISRRYAELLGGTLSCESRAGNGTVFTLRLPVEHRVDDA